MPRATGGATKGAEREARQKPPSMTAPHWWQRGRWSGRGVGMEPSDHQAWSRGKHGGSVT
jgi:hypothetical protein